MNTTILQAADECRKRMNSYTTTQREELYESALKYIYPQGFKICDNKHIGVFIGKDEECPLCEEKKFGNGEIPSESKQSTALTGNQ